MAERLPISLMQKILTFEPDDLIPVVRLTEPDPADRNKVITGQAMNDLITKGGGTGNYVLPTASDIVKGGVKIGSGLVMNGEVLSTIASNDEPGLIKLTNTTIKDGVTGGYFVGRAFVQMTPATDNFSLDVTSQANFEFRNQDELWFTSTANKAATPTYTVTISATNSTPETVQRTFTISVEEQITGAGTGSSAFVVRTAKFRGNGTQKSFPLVYKAAAPNECGVGARAVHFVDDYTFSEDGMSIIFDEAPEDPGAGYEDNIAVTYFQDVGGLATLKENQGLDSVLGVSNTSNKSIVLTGVNGNITANDITAVRFKAPATGGTATGVIVRDSTGWMTTYTLGAGLIFDTTNKTIVNTGGGTGTGGLHITNIGWNPDTKTISTTYNDNSAGPTQILSGLAKLTDLPTDFVSRINGGQFNAEVSFFSSIKFTGTSTASITNALNQKAIDFRGNTILYANGFPVASIPTGSFVIDPAATLETTKMKFLASPGVKYMMVRNADNTVGLDPMPATVTPYTLPAASPTTRGGVRTGAGLYMNNTDMINVKLGYGLQLNSTSGAIDVYATSDYVLPTASGVQKGGIRVGEGLYMNGDILNANPSSYSLPAATTTTRGGIRYDNLNGLTVASGDLLRVKIGNGLAFNSTGTIYSTVSSYVLPAATASTRGGIRIDTLYGLTARNNDQLGIKIVGSGLAFDANGYLYATTSGSGTYTLPTASTTTKGGVKINGNHFYMNGDVLNVRSELLGGSGYVLPAATASTRGGIRIGTAYGLEAINTDVLKLKIGTGLAFDSSGTLVCTVTGGGTYTLPAASTTTRGGIRVGSGLAISNTDVLSATAKPVVVGSTTDSTAETKNTSKTAWTNFTAMTRTMTAGRLSFYVVRINVPASRTQMKVRLYMGTEVTEHLLTTVSDAGFTSSEQTFFAVSSQRSGSTSFYVSVLLHEGAGIQATVVRQQVYEIGD